MVYHFKDKINEFITKSDLERFAIIVQNQKKQVWLRRSTLRHCFRNSAVYLRDLRSIPISVNLAAGKATEEYFAAGSHCSYWSRDLTERPRSENKFPKIPFISIKIDKIFVKLRFYEDFALLDISWSFFVLKLGLGTLCSQIICIRLFQCFYEKMYFFEYVLQHCFLMALWSFCNEPFALFQT